MIPCTQHLILAPLSSKNLFLPVILYREQSNSCREVVSRIRVCLNMPVRKQGMYVVYVLTVCPLIF